jgi:hypothetical protein
MSNKIFLGSIDDNVTFYLNELLKVKLEDHLDNTDREYMIEFSAKQKSESTKKIINIIQPFFEKSGIEVNLDTGYISYESYTYNSPQYVDTPIDIGCANEQQNDSQVCYIITKKDNRLKGGNMIIYDEYTLLNVIGYKDTVTKEIPLQSGSVLIITGDTYYKLRSCAGFGELNLIRIGCYRNKPYRCDNDE